MVLLAAASPGSFRGKIVEGPNTAGKNWLYIQGRNGMVRRVDVSHAHVEYDEDVPMASRSRIPQDALKPGVDVRITAEQGQRRRVAGESDRDHGLRSDQRNARRS